MQDERLLTFQTLKGDTEINIILVATLIFQKRERPKTTSAPNCCLMQLNNLSKGLPNHLTIPAGCGFCALSWAGNFQESRKVRLLLLSSWQIKKPEHPTKV